MMYLEFDRGGLNMGVEHSFHYIDILSKLPKTLERERERERENETETDRDRYKERDREIETKRE